MKWFSKKPKELFLHHERIVLDATRTALPHALQQAFLERIESINLVQRHGDGQEVNMYQEAGGRVAFSETKLIQSEEETVVATVVLSSPTSKAKPVGKVWAVGGYVFQIMFNAKLERLRSCDAVVSVELGPEFSEASAFVDELRWELIPGAEVSSVSPPLSADRRSNALRLIPEPMPDDYLDLVTRTNGFSIAGWKVLGLEDVYEAPGSPGDYVIAELREVDEEYGDLALVTRKRRLLLLRMDDPSETQFEGLSFVQTMQATSQGHHFAG